MKLDIGYEWIKLNHDNYKEFENKPAIYRWTFFKNNQYYVYIGETLNFKNRINFYKNPGKCQETNRKIKEDYMKQSEKIILEKLKLNKLVIDNCDKLLNLSQEELFENIYYRKLFENFILINTKEQIVNTKGRNK